MTFTLTLAPLNDIARVRLAIGDTDAAAPKLQDELITALIAENGTWQRGAIACVRLLIAQLSGTPSFQADWLRVDTGAAVSDLHALLIRLETQYETGTTLTASSISPRRTDYAEDAWPP